MFYLTSEAFTPSLGLNWNPAGPAGLLLILDGENKKIGGLSCAPLENWRIIPFFKFAGDKLDNFIWTKWFDFDVLLS